MLYSMSEERGLASLSPKDLKVYSIGISTAGEAERRMALASPKRSVIATTIDLKGAEYAREHLRSVSSQVEVKLEDIREPLPYPNDHFDFIYARLVLHYLSKPELDRALLESKRVLKPAGNFFLVVRSLLCPDALGSPVDPTSGLTQTVSEDKGPISRYFHSEKSIEEHLSKAGFALLRLDKYKERLCSDFQRKVPSSQEDHLIEALAMCRAD